MRAAFYESDITPPLGEYMWGYYCKRDADDVRHRLYAKAFVAESAGSIAAIVCVDTCVLPREMHDIVCKRIEAYTGIKPENVCICCNHTHRGAPVFSSPELNQYADSAYVDVFYRLVADSVILAYRRLEDAALSFGTETVEGIAFNRNALFDDGQYHTWIRSEHFVSSLGEVDPSLYVMKVEQDGKPVGALINYTLHQDTAGVSGYSGDYASTISEELKKTYGSDFVSLFVLGTCGDINHINPDLNAEPPIEQASVPIGKAIAEQAKRAMEQAKPVSGGVSVKKEKITVAKRVVGPDQDAVQAELRKMLDNNAGMMRIRNFIYYCAANETDREDLYVQTIRLGDTAIYALPGEVYVNYGLEIKSKSPAAHNMVVELCNNYCGYIPSKKAFDACSNLYESSLCFHSCMEPDTGDKLVAKALEQAAELFR